MSPKTFRAVVITVAPLILCLSLLWIYGFDVKKIPVFMPGQEWTMLDSRAMALVKWSVKSVPLNFGCYKAKDLVELDITKTDANAYWAPGRAQNARIFLYKGNYIVGVYVTDMMTGEVIYTFYYFSPKGEPLADKLIGAPGASYAAHAVKVLDKGMTNRCPSEAEVQAAIHKEAGATWQDWVTEWRMENGLLRADYFEERPCAFYVETWWYDVKGLVRLDAHYQGGCGYDGRTLVRQ